MADVPKRIIDLDPQTTPTAGQYWVVDDNVMSAAKNIPPEAYFGGASFPAYYEIVELSWNMQASMYASYSSFTDKAKIRFAKVLAVKDSSNRYHDPSNVYDSYVFDATRQKAQATSASVSITTTASSHQDGQRLVWAGYISEGGTAGEFYKDDDIISGNVSCSFENEGGTDTKYLITHNCGRQLILQVIPYVSGSDEPYDDRCYFTTKYESVNANSVSFNNQLDDTTHKFFAYLYDAYTAFGGNRTHTHNVSGNTGAINTSANMNLQTCTVSCVWDATGQTLRLHHNNFGQSTTSVTPYSSGSYSNVGQLSAFTSAKVYVAIFRDF